MDDLEMRGYVSAVPTRDNGKTMIVNPRTWIDG